MSKCPQWNCHVWINDFSLFFLKNLQSECLICCQSMKYLVCHACLKSKWKDGTYARTAKVYSQRKVMVLKFTLIQCGANTSTGVFHNICQLFLPVGHLAVATFGVLWLAVTFSPRPLLMTAEQPDWLWRRGHVPGGVSISSFLDGCTLVLKRSSSHLFHPGKVKSDNIRRSNSINIFIILFSNINGLRRSQLYNVTAGARQTSDLNFVSTVYDNSCISADRTAFILVSTFVDLRPTDLRSIKISLVGYRQL